MRMIGDGLSKKGRSGTVDDIRQRNDEKREVVGNSGLDDALKRIDPLWALDVKPTLDFDFVRNEYGVYDGEDIVKGQFIDHATVSRNSVATYFDATGKLRTAGVNEPRFTYDPATGEPMGLLIEEQRTNLMLQSENLTSGNWTLAANLTLDADVLVAPDGTLTGDRLTLIGTSGHNIVQAFSQIDGTTYTVSVYAKNVSNFSDFFQIAYYDGPTSVESKTVKITDNWERYSFTFTAQAGVASPQIRLLGFGFGGDGDQVGIWGVQLEVGSFESSYIKTEGSQVTRVADSYSYDLSSISHNIKNGSWLVEFECNQDDAFEGGIIGVGATTTGGRWPSIYYNSELERIDVGLDGKYQASTAGTVPRGVIRAILTIDGFSGSLYSNGELLVGDFRSPEIASAVNTMWFGAAHGNSSKVRKIFLRDVKFIPKTLTDDQAKALSSM